MYYIIINKIFNHMLVKKGLGCEKSVIWKSAIEYMLPLLINILVASGIGHTLDMETKMIVFSIFYTILGVGTGKNYLKLDIKNTVAFWGLGTAFLFGSEQIMRGTYGKYVLACLLLVSFLIVWMLPLKMRKLIWTERIRKEINSSGKVIITIECIFLLIYIFLLESNLIVAAVIGVFIQSLSLIMIPLRHRQIIELCTYEF